MPSSALKEQLSASPPQLGRLPVSYPWIWQTFQKAAARAGIGKLGTHSLRHSYRSWLDAVGTAIAVQQKLMRHSDIRTTLNIYGDVVTDEMSEPALLACCKMNFFASSISRLIFPPVTSRKCSSNSNVTLGRLSSETLTQYAGSPAAPNPSSLSPTPLPFER